MKNFEETKKLINEAEIISFDLFDTLVIRPYWQPKDLFLHLEYLYKSDGFCNARIKAENLSRKNIGFGVDTSLDRIYQFIPEKYRHLKEKELELEYNTLQINSEILYVFNYAKNLDKKIIISSDMYLPLSFIKIVLSKLNIAGYSKVYVSSEYKKTKISGKLYKQIIKDFNINPKDVLHIGDNKISDFYVPKFLGIKTYLYPKINEQFIKSNKTFKKLVKDSKLTLGLSTALSVCAINWHKQKYVGKQENYFYNLGFNIGGFLAYSFCKFVAKYAKENDIEKVFFVARGGYTLEKVFNFLEPEIKTDYVVLSRTQNIINKLLEKETDIYSNKRYLFYTLLLSCKKIFSIKFFDKIINKFYPMEGDFYYKVLISLRNLYSPNKIFKNNITIENSKNFYLENKQEIDNLLSKQKAKFVNYLQEKTSNIKNILIVDDCAIAFSAQKLCEDLLENKNIFGIYFQIFSKKKPSNIKFVSFSKKYINLFNWEFIEFLFTAPTPPIMGVDENFNVIYNKVNEYEQKRIEIYKYISVGMVDFVKEIKAKFGNRDIFVNSKDAGLWINNFFKNYTKKDYKNMLGIYTTPDQTRYFPLFSYKPKVKEILFNPIKYLYNCSHVICPTLLQRVLCFPIRILRYIVNYY